VRAPIIATTLLVTAMALCSPRALAIAPHHSTCLPKGAQTVAKDSVARVFALPPANSKTLLPLSRRRLYGCIFRRGVAVPMVSERRFSSWGHVVLAGTTVAYASEFMGIDFGTASVTTFDLRRARTIASLDAWTFIEQGLPESFYSVTGIVLETSGSMAWLSRMRAISGSTSYQVHEVGPSGSTALLDHGPEVQPTSLRLSKGTVSWMNGSTGMSAQLP
jgi:hypothetical protein